MNENGKYIEPKTIDRTDLKPIDRHFVSKFEDFCNSFRKSFKSLSPHRINAKREGFHGFPFEQTAATKEELKDYKQDNLKSDLNISSIWINGINSSKLDTPNKDVVGRSISHTVKEQKLDTSQTVKDQRESICQSSFLNEDNSFQYRMDRQRISSFVQQDPKSKLRIEDINGKINPSELEIIKQIGSGSFGTVYLWYENCCNLL